MKMPHRAASRLKTGGQPATGFSPRALRQHQREKIIGRNGLENRKP